MDFFAAGGHSRQNATTRACFWDSNQECIPKADPHAHDNSLGPGLSGGNMSACFHAVSNGPNAVQCGVGGAKW